MRHVDEGALHAWLDGELDALPPGEAERIREHLDGCEACARRLEEERRVRDAAEGVLAAAPVELSGLPSLEEMRVRARRGAGAGGGAGGTRARARQMAWAASVVLAAGAGWMANALFPRIQDDRSPAVQFLRQDSGTLVAPAAAPEPSDEGAGASARGAAPVAQDAPPPPAGGEAVREEPAAEKVAAPEAEARSRESDLASAPVSASPRPESLAVGIAPSADEAGTAPAVLLRRATVDAAGAGEGLIVPGLPVISTTFLVPGDPGAGVRVRQRLPDGTVLEVYHLPTGRGPDLLPALEEGAAQWVAPREAGWLVLRGNVGEAELQALGERLLGG